ncbi:MAG: hypothetical protein R6V40_03685 [Candidatus Moraniibacteriota bacterium]
MENFEKTNRSVGGEAEREKRKGKFDISSLDLPEDLLEFAEEKKELAQQALDNPYCLEEIEDLETKNKLQTIVEIAENKADTDQPEQAFTPKEKKEIEEYMERIMVGEDLVSVLDQAPGKYHNEIAQKLVKRGLGEEVAENLVSFYNLSHTELTKSLTKLGQEHIVLELIDDLDINYNLFAKAMINNDKIGGLIANLTDFNNLDKYVARQILGNGNKRRLLMNLNSFTQEAVSDIAITLINEDCTQFVEHDIKKFRVLEQSVAEELIRHKRTEKFFYNFGKFTNINHQYLAELIVETGQGTKLEHNLYRLSDIDEQRITDLLLLHNNFIVIISNALTCLKKIDYQKVADKMLNKGKSDLFFIFLKKIGINNLDKKKLINKLGIWEILDNLHYFKYLDQSDCEDLINTVLTTDNKSLVRKFSKKIFVFTSLDKKVAEKLIDCGESGVVAEYINKFKNLDKDILLKLLARHSYLMNTTDLSFLKKEDRDEIELFFYKAYEINIPTSEIYYLKDELLADKELDEDDYQKMFQCLQRERVDEWQDEENISGPFLVGAEYFGYKKMFKYIANKERHDVLYNFRKIVELAEQSGLKPEQFYGQIINKVAMDTADYGMEDDEPKSSYQYLNQIADAVEVSEIEANMEKAKDYPKIEKLQQLAGELQRPKDVLQDWKYLKKYYELTQLLAKTELLEQLKELKAQGKDKLYNYVESLAFHPNIDMQKVMQFWQNPERFLGVEDFHSSQAHELKKPSNYIDIPYLDLDAEELRDALVEGDMDKLQDWQPLEAVYQVPRDLDRKDPLRYEIAKRVGVSDPEIRYVVGIAQDEQLKRNGKLFSKLSKRFKSENIDIKEYLKGNQNLTRELEQELEEEYQISREKNLEEYRVKINLKSDPDGVVAGNDTACCMPFGSGKNNVYTYNPACALFTVQRKLGDKWKTVAQSVLTKDINVGREISEIVKEMQESDVHMNELVSEDILNKSENIIACDNIEVAPNFKTHPNKDRILEHIYRDFFGEYCQRYGDKENLDTSQAIIGMGYTDAITHLRDTKNTYAPIAPVGYSDNLGEKALRLDLGEKSEYEQRIRKEVWEQEKPQREDLDSSSIKGVENLTFKDSLQVAYLEGKAYFDNKNLMEYLHNMENALIAKDINNNVKDRANLSLKYTDKNERMRGYLLAYEGKYDNEEAIYIADLAADPESNLAGGRLIKEFVNRYKEKYLNNGVKIPVVAKAREKTSYGILKKQLDKISEDLGIKFEMEEAGEFYEGGEKMYEVIVRPQ